jgi:hypothetical protein
MGGHRIAQSLQFAVNALLAQGRLEGQRIEKDVDVF